LAYKPSMRASTRLFALLSFGLIGAACGSSDSSPTSETGPDAGVTDAGSTAADASNDVSPATCSALGASCTTGSGCCSAYCKASVCTCNSDGYACSTNTDCCASDCVSGKCGGPSDGSTIAAASGVLDATYGAHGCATLAYAGDPRNNSRPFATAFDGAGNLFVVGDTEIDASGGTDASASGWFTSLGPTGSVTTNITIPPSFGTIYELAISPSGEPTLFGDGVTNIMRTSAAGVRDASFMFGDGDAGSVGSNSAPAYQSTGALVFSNGSYVVRVDPSGALDPTFGDAGRVAFGTMTLPLSADAMGVDSQDRIYVAGFANVAGANDWMLARLLPSGVLDPTFGLQGLADAGPAPYYSQYLATFKLAVSHSGNDVYLAATYSDPNLDYAPLWIVHASATGIDAAYGGRGGHAVVAGPAMAGPYPNVDPTFNLVDTAVQDDGELVIAGTDGLGEYWYLTRITIAGAVDPTYGSSG
jgi:hypothetical protein